MLLHINIAGITDIMSTSMRLRYCNAVHPRQLLMLLNEACNRNEVMQAKT